MKTRRLNFKLQNETSDNPILITELRPVSYFEKAAQKFSSLNDDSISEDDTIEASEFMHKTSVLSMCREWILDSNLVMFK